MKRVLGLLIAATVCAGCRNPSPVYDPFIGKTTIDPPGTVTPPPSQPYYTPPPGGNPTPAPPPGSIPPGFTPAPAGFSSFNPNVSPPGATPISSQPAQIAQASAPPRPSYGPPGAASPQAGVAPQYGPSLVAQSTVPAPLSPQQTYGSRALGVPGGQSNNVTPAASWQSPDVNRTPQPAPAASSAMPPDSRPIRVVPPAASTWPTTSSINANQPNLAASRGAVSPATLNQSLAASRAPELGDLPPPRFVGPGVAVPPAAVSPAVAIVPGNPTRATGVQQASAITASPVRSSSPSGSAFGYDPQYHWLKGKLEYSQSTRKWRLRYIPPDGTTDDFGGSVILADNVPMAGLQSGDFVAVQGSVGATGSDPTSFAPLYNVAQIQKQ